MGSPSTNERASGLVEEHGHVDGWPDIALNELEPPIELGAELDDHVPPGRFGISFGLVEIHGQYHVGSDPHHEAVEQSVVAQDRGIASREVANELVVRLLTLNLRRQAP